MALEILSQNMYDWIYNLCRTLRERMKSKDLQTAVKNKYDNGDGPTKIYRDLGRVVSLRTQLDKGAHIRKPSFHQR